MINRGLMAAGAVLLLANGAILVNVARNRAGNPDAVIRLTERELRSYVTQEEGAEEMLELRLTWETAAGAGSATTWFDRARLEALGVTELPAGDDTTWTPRCCASSRPAYVVLELAGPAWERRAAAEQAHRDSTNAARTARGVDSALAPWLESDGATATRLMAVDIGPDPWALRQRYPDRSIYLILPATYEADITVSVRDTAGAVVAPTKVAGRIAQLLPGTVHVPRPLRDSLLTLGAARNDSTRKFAVNFKVGRRWEGWVE
ncbi:MAG TPA: DUF4824 family protein [Gemmatimonadales bacterium]|jgi:hypothetical protein|nr:DUF4824 family protein [Gemmatimonadales bacterium]